MSFPGDDVSKITFTYFDTGPTVQSVNEIINIIRYYKKNIIAKKDQLFMENLSIISPNSKTIKYIGRNENNTELNEKNLLRLNITKNKVPYLKEKQALKRNKSNHIYFLKNSKFSNIISPPNYLNCKKMKFL